MAAKATWHEAPSRGDGVPSPASDQDTGERPVPWLPGQLRVASGAGNTELFERRAAEAAASGQLDDAVALFGRALNEAGPAADRETLGRLWAGRGRVFAEQRDYVAARAELQRAVETGGANAAPAVRMALAVSLRFCSQYHEASLEVQKVLEAEPENQHARLEERRLQQRIAHAQGEDLDTWKRKSGAKAVAKDIQARAEHSIKETRARMAGGEVGLLARDREKALEAGFFAQVEAAKEEQKRATEQRQREIVSLSGGLLDMDLGGVDVDALLQSLKEIPADPNVFPTLAAHARDMDAPAAAPPHVAPSASKPAPVEDALRSERTLPREGEAPAPRSPQAAAPVGPAREAAARQGPQRSSIAARLRAFRGETAQTEASGGGRDESEAGQALERSGGDALCLRPVETSGRQARRMEVTSERLNASAERAAPAEERGDTAPSGEAGAETLNPSRAADAAPTLRPVPMTAQQARRVQTGQQRLDAAAQRAAAAAPPALGGRGRGVVEPPLGRGGGVGRGAGRGRLAMADDESSDEEEEAAGLHALRSSLKSRSREANRQEEEEAERCRAEAQVAPSPPPGPCQGCACRGWASLGAAGGQTS